MTHQTGIQANKELLKTLADAKTSGKIRLLKIVIENEEMVLALKVSIKGNWEADYQSMLEPHLLPTEACYFLFRLDSSNAHGSEWIYVNWVPNNAHVKQKMIYAATRATLAKEFGGSCFAEKGGILFGTVKEDCTLEGFKNHLISEAAPPPLTMAEEEMDEIRRTEVREMAVDKRQETLKGVAFPLTSKAGDALRRFAAGDTDYVQCMIEIASEKVDLAAEVPRLEASQLASQVPEEVPRYHLFRFRHQHQGKSLVSIVFVYSMPGYKCSIKERMLYSSCRSGFIDTIELLKITADKKFEVESGAEMTQEYLMEELHPSQAEAKKVFAKPKGPGGRGPRRLHKD